MFFIVGSTCPENFDLAHAERAALAGRAEPAEEEAEQLPQRIDAEAAGHDRVALEVAGEEPEVGLELEHRADQALAVFAADFRDFGNAVEHQHRRQRQLRALDKKLAPPAGQQVLVFEIRTALLHAYPAPPFPADCQSLTYWGNAAKPHPRALHLRGGKLDPRHKIARELQQAQAGV